MDKCLILPEFDFEKKILTELQTCKNIRNHKSIERCFELISKWAWQYCVSYLTCCYSNHCKVLKSSVL